MGELQVQNAAYTVAELPIGNFLVRSLAPSRINRPGRIPVQTAAEKWTTRDYRCVKGSVPNWHPDRTHAALEFRPPPQRALNASAFKGQTRTPAMMLSKENTMRFTPRHDFFSLDAGALIFFNI